MTKRRMMLSTLLALLCLLTACSVGGKKEQGKPILTGSFVKEAERTDTPESSEDSYLQTMQVGLATITLGRFGTNHAAEAYLDRYYGGDFDVTERVELPGAEGTHYRWRYGSNEDSAVMDAVIAEADGCCLLFFCSDPVDAFEGDREEGPDQAKVDGWLRELSVTHQ